MPKVGLNWNAVPGLSHIPTFFLKRRRVISANHLYWGTWKGTPKLNGRWRIRRGFRSRYQGLIQRPIPSEWFFASWIIHPSFPPPQKNIFPLPTLNIIHHLHFMKTFIMEGSSRFFLKKERKDFLEFSGILANSSPANPNYCTNRCFACTPLGTAFQAEKGGRMNINGRKLSLARFVLFFVVEVFFDSTFIALRKARFYGPGWETHGVMTGMKVVKRYDLQEVHWLRF